MSSFLKERARVIGEMIRVFNSNSNILVARNTDEDDLGNHDAGQWRVMSIFYHCEITSFTWSIYAPAFTEDWTHENNWICPPVNLIGSVFRHMEVSKATGTIFVPAWQSAYFWPLLCPDGIRLAYFVKDFMILSPHYVSRGNNKVFVGKPSFKALALFYEV